MKRRFVFSSLSAVALATVLFSCRNPDARVGSTSAAMAAPKPLACTAQCASGTNQAIGESSAVNEANEAVLRARANLEERLEAKRAIATNAPSEKLSAEIASLEDLKARLDALLGAQRSAVASNEAPVVASTPAPAQPTGIVAIATASVSPEQKTSQQVEKATSPVSEVSQPEKQSFLKKLLARRQPGTTAAAASQPATNAAPPAAPAVAATPVAPPAAAPSAVAEAPKPAEAAPAAAAVTWQEVTAGSMQDVRATADQSLLALKNVSARPVTIQCDLAARPDLAHAKAQPVAAAEGVAPKYAGEWQDGAMNGHGSLVYPDGAQYVGQWKANLMDGLGQYIDPSGCQYVGEWRDGIVEGDGILTNPDGWKYSGQWHDGKRSGQGKVLCSDGWEYVGGWSNGWMQGEGKLTLPKQGSYAGAWRDGKQDGQGTFTYPNGSQYVGQWHNGRREGHGVLSYPDGWKYDGQWANDTLDGAGTLTHPDGWTYTGQWKNGKMDGQGELQTQQKKVDPSAK